MFAKTAIVSLALASVALADCTRNYTVVAGDICDGISAANGVSTFQLAVVNNIVNDACSNLAIGQNLCLGWPGQDCTEIYKVQKGDTCSAIAKGANIDAATLWNNNPQIDADCNNIYIGQVLCVSSTKYEYPEIVTVTQTVSKAAVVSEQSSDDSSEQKQPEEAEETTSYVAAATSYEDLPWCDEL